MNAGREYILEVLAVLADSVEGDDPFRKVILDAVEAVREDDGLLDRAGAKLMERLP